jgi:hypothetical protein
MRVGAVMIFPPKPSPHIDVISPKKSALVNNYALIVPTFDLNQHMTSTMIRKDRGNRLASHEPPYDEYEGDAGAEPRLESISLTPRSMPSLKSMSHILLSRGHHQAGVEARVEGRQGEKVGFLVDISLGVTIERMTLASNEHAAFSPAHDSILALSHPSSSPSPSSSSIVLIDATKGHEICHLVIKAPASTDIISDGETLAEGCIIDRFAFSPKGQFIVAQVSASHSSTRPKTSEGDGKDKVRSWLYLWRVKGEAREYEEKLDQDGNPVLPCYETPLW